MTDIYIITLTIERLIIQIPKLVGTTRKIHIYTRKAFNFIICKIRVIT